MKHFKSYFTAIYLPILILSVGLIIGVNRKEAISKEIVDRTISGLQVQEQNSFEVQDTWNDKYIISVAKVKIGRCSYIICTQHKDYGARSSVSNSTAIVHANDCDNPNCQSKH